MDLLTTVWQWLQQFGYWLQGLGVVSLLAGIPDKVWPPSLKDLIRKTLSQRFEKQLQDADHAFQGKRLAIPS